MQGCRAELARTDAWPAGQSAGWVWGNPMGCFGSFEDRTEDADPWSACAADTWRNGASAGPLDLDRDHPPNKRTLSDAG